MASFTIPLLVVFVSNLLYSSAVDPLYNICTKFDNYTAGDPFSKNLEQLLSKLSTAAPQKGFAIASVGAYPTRVNGLVQCRGDVTSTACSRCVRTAADDVRSLCPLKRDGIVWYDNCLLKYSDDEFFGDIDNQNKFYLYNTKNVTSNPRKFNDEVKKLLTDLALRAQAVPSLFATGETKIKEESSETLYGLVQCTRDLSERSCKMCLDTAIAELPTCCDGKVGGRVVGGSCTIRYETYPIVNTDFN